MSKDKVKDKKDLDQTFGPIQKKPTLDEDPRDLAAAFLSQDPISFFHHLARRWHIDRHGFTPIEDCPFPGCQMALKQLKLIQARPQAKPKSKT